MLSHCLKCRKNIESKKQKVVKPNKGKTGLSSIMCSACDSKKFRFIKEQEASGLLSNLGLKAVLSKILILGDMFFYSYKTNEIVNNFY